MFQILLKKRPRKEVSFMRKGKGRFGTVLIVLLVALVGVGAVGFLSQGFKNLDYKDWFKNDDDSSTVDPNSDEATVGITENGITLKPLFADSTTTKSFSYTVDPSVHTGSISYSLTCSNTSTNPSDYYSVVLDTENQTVSITLVDICDYQCLIKLYSVDNPDVNAVVTLDYQQRILSVVSTLNAVEGSPLSIHDVVTKSKGSIAVSSAVTSSSLTFDADFVAAAQDLVSFTAVPLNNPVTTDYGLDDASNWLTTNYSDTSFLGSIKEVVTGTSTVTGSQKTYTKSLLDCQSTDILNLFDGTKPVFNYTAVVNGTEYKTDFALEINSIPITGIDPSTTSIVF